MGRAKHAEKLREIRTIWSTLFVPVRKLLVTFVEAVLLEWMVFRN